MAAESAHDRFSIDGGRAATAAYATAAIRLRIGGALRFLSHAETLRVLQRACSRAALPVRYTAGFNPHPRLSLPLPRPVGVESEDDLLVARIQVGPAGLTGDRASEEALAMGRVLARELPEGMQVLGVTMGSSRAAFRPTWVDYVLPLRSAGAGGAGSGLERAVSRVMAAESCMVDRTAPGRTGGRRLDVRPFLHSARLEGGEFLVRCRTGTGGSIRVDEIMEIFGLKIDDLAGPVRRTSIAWETEQGEQTPQPFNHGREDKHNDT